MSSMNQDLVRAVTDARLASARERQLARAIRHDRRLARRAARQRVANSRPGRRAPQKSADIAPLVPVVDVGPRTRGPDEAAFAHLEAILGAVAVRIAENGTRSEVRLLGAMSAAAQEASPGAAAALVDWDGSEIARLRAFGILHRVVLEDLDPSDQSWILGEMLGTDDVALAV